jgi:hypothetical protein
MTETPASRITGTIEKSAPSVEDSSVVRMPGQVFEECGAVYEFERRLLGSNRLL